MNRRKLFALLSFIAIPCAAAVSEPVGINPPLEGGATVGRHYAGPTWESSSDRSSVKGAVRERQDGGAGNIPWLLLAGTSNGADGKMGGVTSIQRVATKGGIEPTVGCEASKMGQEVRVPYTADYYFYKRK
jgi:hypothetical protein